MNYQVSSSRNGSAMALRRRAGLDFFREVGNGSPAFLAFGPAPRKVIYTTNSIESLNYQRSKIITNRGHFPNDAGAVKLPWLAIRTIEDKRARERAKEAWQLTT